MKKLITFVLGLLFIYSNAQPPTGMGYQAVLRGADGQVLSNKDVWLRVALVAGATEYYSEVHAVRTTAQGLVTLTVGAGTEQAGIFAGVPWATSAIGLRIGVRLSATGGFTDMGVQPLQAVPYALYSASGIPGRDGVSVQWLGSSASHPASPTRNQAYYNTAEGKAYIYDGDSWEVLVQDGQRGPAGTGLTLRGNWSSTASYVAGDYVFDRSSVGETVNSMWICKISVGATSSHPWEDTAHWVEFQAPEGPRGAEGQPGISVDWLGDRSTPPEPVIRNQAYYNTVDRKAYIYDEGAWQVLVQDGRDGQDGMVIPGVEGQTMVYTGTGWDATSKIAITADTVKIGTITPISKLVVQGGATSLPEDPIFEVRNKDGKVVLGVYNEGVRVYVDDSGVKGAKGGFAVGGLSTQGKASGVEYLRITPDSARIYIDTSTAKGAKGGFAVGGLSTQGKAGKYDMLRVTRDSTRVYVKESPTKGAKGGFAVGGLSTQGKAASVQFLNITPDNYFIGHQAGDSINGGLYNSFMGYQSGKANTTGSNNVFLGYKSGRFNQIGVNNVVVGNLAGYLGTSSSNNVFLGDSAGFGNTNSYNVFLGKGSGKSNSGEYNSFMGYRAGLNNTTGSNNVFIGNETGKNNMDGNHNTFLGYMAGFSNNASYNTFLGYNAGYSNTSGSYNCFWGTEAGYSNEDGSSNIFVGNKAGYSSTSGSNNIFLGYKTGYTNVGNFNIMLGNESGYANSDGEYNVFIGFQSGNNNTLGNSNTFIGFQSGKNYTTGSYNTFFGYQAGFASELSKGTGKNNVALGYKAGNSLTYGENNIFIGTEAGGSTTGIVLDTIRGENTFIGYWAGKNNTTGYQNIAIGYQAGLRLSSNNRNTLVGSSAGQELSSGSANTFFGTYAGRLTSSGKNNTLVGYDCGYQVYTGSHNTFVGFQAGRGWGAIAIGDSSVFIGNQAGSYEAGSNKLYISNSSTGNPLVWGDFKLGYATVHGKLGINTKTPGYSVEAYGANASIIAHYGSNTRGGISAFPLYRLAFLATDVSNDLVFGYSPDPDQADFSTAFVERMRIDNGTGNVGINTDATAPTHKFDLRGEMRISANTAYDVWIQGGNQIGGGDNRNLAILGLTESNGDKLYLNYDGEYTAGTEINGYIIANGNVGIISANPALQVMKNISGNAAATITNLNNSTTADGLYIRAGTNATSFGAKFIKFIRQDGSEIGSINQNAATTVQYATSSDARLKENITNTKFSLSDLIRLKVYDFNFIKDPEKKRMTGFTAQELYEIYPDAVSKPTKEDGIWQVDYGRITPLLVKAIQDQQQQISNLEGENLILKQKIKEIDALKAELEAIKTMLKK